MLWPLGGGKVSAGPHSTWDEWSTGRRVSITIKNRHQFIDGVLHGSRHNSGDPCLMGTPVMGPTMPFSVKFINWQIFHSLAMHYEVIYEKLSCSSMHLLHLTLFLYSLQFYIVTQKRVTYVFLTE